MCIYIYIHLDDLPWTQSPFKLQCSITLPNIFVGRSPSPPTHRVKIRTVLVREKNQNGVSQATQPGKKNMLKMRVFHSKGAWNDMSQDFLNTCKFEVVVCHLKGCLNSILKEPTISTKNCTCVFFKRKLKNPKIWVTKCHLNILTGQITVRSPYPSSPSKRGDQPAVSETSSSWQVLKSDPVFGGSGTPSIIFWDESTHRFH